MFSLFLFSLFVFFSLSIALYRLIRLVEDDDGGGGGSGDGGHFENSA